MKTDPDSPLLLPAAAARAVEDAYEHAARIVETTIILRRRDEDWHVTMERATKAVAGRIREAALRHIAAARSEPQANDAERVREIQAAALERAAEIGVLDAIELGRSFRNRPEAESRAKAQVDCRWLRAEAGRVRQGEWGDAPARPAPQGAPAAVQRWSFRMVLGEHGYFAGAVTDDAGNYVAYSDLGPLLAAAREEGRAEAVRQRDAAVDAADGYAGDLAAIVRTMNKLDYPHHPEYPNDDEIIRRLIEMANRLAAARREGAEAMRAEALKCVERPRHTTSKEWDLKVTIERAIRALPLPGAATEPAREAGTGRDAALQAVIDRVRAICTTSLSLSPDAGVRRQADRINHYLREMESLTDEPPPAPGGAPSAGPRGTFLDGLGLPYLAAAAPAAPSEEAGNDESDWEERERQERIDRARAGDER